MDDIDRKLLATARSAMWRAHAPYSGFRVGAALLTEDGRIHVGVNVENASLGLSLCAERVAAATAIASAASKFLRIAIASSAGKPTPPCGACRQFLFEFAPTMQILLDDGSESPPRHTLQELLPLAFEDYRPGSTP